MISWIQKTFQQHFRIIFAVLLVLIIVSFVFTIGAAPGIGQGDPKRQQRTFFDLNLSSTEDQQRLLGDASLSAYLQSGYSPEAEQLQPYALHRYAALHIANELDLPAPTLDEIAAHVQTLRAFAGPDGKFDAKRYADFRDSLKTNPRLNEGDVSRVLTDDLRFQTVEKLLAGPGYVLPADVKTQLVRADSTWTLSVATVDYASFKPEVAVTDAVLEKFFADNAFRYEIPPQVSVGVIDFPTAAYVGGVKVTDAEVRAYYDANPARFPAPADKKVTAPAALLAKPADTAGVDFAAVRPQVEAALKAERAQRLAIQAASDFSLALDDKKVTAATLDAVLAAHKRTLKPLAPFGRESVPASLGSNPQVATEAFKLGPTRLFSDALATGQGAAILVWKDSLAARQPAFAEVKDRVAADYREGEKRKRFVEVGRTLHSLLETRIKAGDTFDKAATAAGANTSAKIEVKSYPAFTLRTPPADLDYSIYNAFDSLQKGQVSEMTINGDKGLIVYVADKKLPALDEKSPQFIEARDRLAKFTASRNGGEYLAELVEKELAKSAPAIP